MAEVPIDAENQLPAHHWVSPKLELVIFRDGSRVRAFCSICPHMGAQLRYQPNMRRLICPWHGLSADIQSGCTNHPRYRCVREYPVEKLGNSWVVKI